MTDREIAEIASYETSDAFDDLDRLVLRFASAMTETPAEVGDDLRDALRDRIGPAALAELAAYVAWENHRARLNKALGVRAVGFSDGEVCTLPAHPPGAP